MTPTPRIEAGMSAKNLKIVEKKLFKTPKQFWAKKFQDLNTDTDVNNMKNGKSRHCYESRFYKLIC